LSVIIDTVHFVYSTVVTLSATILIVAIFHLSFHVIVSVAVHALLFTTQFGSFVLSLSLITMTSSSILTLFTISKNLSN